MAEPTRRQLLVTGAATAALGGLSTTVPCAVAEAGTAALGRWRYGNGSFSTETVLMFRGNPTHTFYGTGPLPDAPRLKWRFRTAAIRYVMRGGPVTWAGTGWTGTAVKLGDYVFVGSVGGYVYALEAETGKLVWSHKAKGMFKSSLAAFDNRLYVGNTDNLLRCIDAATGRHIWRYDTGNDLDSSPCIVDGRLYIAGENGFARCFDARSGRLIWKTFMGGIGPGTPLGSNGSETSPAIADGEYYAVNYHGIMHCLDTRDGRIKWKASTGDDTDASPVVDGEFVYAAAEERASSVFCFARQDGREVWRYGANRRGYWSTPAVVGKRLYVGGDDGQLHCLNVTTGRQIWTFKTGAGIWSSPCVVDNKVVFGSRDAHLYILDATTGRQIWRHRVDGRIISSPCIVGGNVWIGSATGYFYCFGL